MISKFSPPRDGYLMTIPSELPWNLTMAPWHMLWKLTQAPAHGSHFFIYIYIYIGSTTVRFLESILHFQTPKQNIKFQPQAPPIKTECEYIYIYIYIWVNYRRKFRSQTSNNMDRWKAEQGRCREKRKIRRGKSRRERVRRKKIQMREKVGKSRFTVFFQWFVAPEGRKVGSLKRRVRSQLARWEMKNCTPLWREAHFQVKMYKTHHSRTTFGSWDVEKVHAVVARSTFPSQNVQNTSASDHFWKLRCRKSARRCGAKHISKSKVLKTDGLGPLLEVEMSKKCTPLWREAHFQVKSVKTDGLGPLLEVQLSKKCRKSARRCGAKHISKSKV